MDMMGFQTSDILALAAFAAAWLGYRQFVEGAAAASGSLNSLMNQHRLAWMAQMAERDIRIVDSAIMASLQNGTAFFASTSLLALGASASLLRATDDVLKLFSDMPFGPNASRGLWESKVLGLAVIFGYAFFKFSWAYRLFNYSAVLIGATPPASSPDAARRRRIAYHAARMSISAARHFSRGQRAFFFALGYLGWFVSPYVLMATTACILAVMAARQFSSDARHALLDEPPEDFAGPAA